MLFRQLFDAATSSYTYLLADPITRHAVLIDPVREQVERDATLIRELGLNLVWILETHVHADHITGGGLLARMFGAKRIACSSTATPCNSDARCWKFAVPPGIRKDASRTSPAT